MINYMQLYACLLKARLSNCVQIDQDGRQQCCCIKVHGKKIENQIFNITKYLGTLHFTERIYFYKKCKFI